MTITFAKKYTTCMQFITNSVNTFSQHSNNENDVIKTLAIGHCRQVKPWDTYNVNGYRFHTESHNESIQTYNCGVCIRMDDDDGENHYYGVLKEIYELSFTNDAQKKVVLFKCEWYDPDKKFGTKRHKHFKLVEINEKRRYPHYDPFIFAHQACQVYYTRFSEGHPGWKSVIKIMPRNIVANQGVERASSHMTPYQEEEQVGVTVDDAIVDCDLRDPIGDCLVIDIGAAMQEEEIEICSSGRSDTESDSDTSES